MIKRGLIVFFAALFIFNSKAQNEFIQQGEIGVTVGAAHYFGDLNTTSSINHPKIALGVYYLKQFNNYLGMRLSGHFAQVGYSDVYSKNEFQQRRNLSFNSNIFEVALHGDFNFFKFNPGDPDHSFTPYVTLGIGLFTFDPYAYIGDRKVLLRPLGTEGQNIGYAGPDGKKRKPYSTTSVCFPIGGGIKYSINNRINLSLQVAQRLTLTDYLDDISTTYIGLDDPSHFPSLPNGKLSDAAILQDRSIETGTRIGTEGRQRGLNKQKDQYIIAEIGISFNLISNYRCPPSN